MNDVQTSRIGQKLLDILSDGQAHLTSKLKMCLTDKELSEDNTLVKQISFLRRALDGTGRDIICQRTEGGIAYRMVRYLNGVDEE